jgi:hypothetical protein
LEDKDTVWRGSLITTKALDTNELKNMVPDKYHEFMDLFGEPLVQELPPNRIFDHPIELKEGKEVPCGPIYYLSEKEFRALREHFDHMLEQGRITESDPNMGVPIIFISNQRENFDYVLIIGD